MKCREFIPPILVRSLNKLIYSRTKPSSPNFFLTYTEAQKACYSAGYEDFDIVDVVFEKTKLVRDQMLSRKFPLSDSAAQSLLAVLYSLQQSERHKQIKVIDFGGACGAHYFQVRPFLLPDIRLDWMVVETPAMVKKAKSFETGELRFVASTLEAKEKFQRFDLLHSSGALQYVPDPQTTIQEFIACESTYLFLNRLALSASETFITIQESFLSANGPGALPYGFNDRVCRYPVTYFPKSRLVELLSQNYQAIIEIQDTKAVINEKELLMNSCIFAERLR